jgi:hypothetical protein
VKAVETGWVYRYVELDKRVVRLVTGRLASGSIMVAFGGRDV